MKKYVNFGCVSLGKSEKRIIDPRSFGSQCIKGTDEGTLEKDSSVPLMHRDPNDLGSMIRFRIFPKKRTLRQSLLKGFPSCSIDLALHLLTPVHIISHFNLITFT